MANFDALFDMDSIFPKGLQDEDLTLDMVKAAQEIVKSAMGNGARRHVNTGSMASSIKATKPKIDKNGDAVGRVLITGKDKSGMSNAQKSLWIEYGTKNVSAMPFVRPSIKSSESTAKSAMEKVFKSKVGG